MAKLTVPVSETDHVQGPTDAPLTLVEYGDYQCSYCGEAYPIVKRVQKKFGTKLRFVFRNFPLTESHPDALHAAHAAEAAALQQKFWEMHDTLYENQENLDDDALLGYAASLKLNTKQWERDFSSAKVADVIQKDFNSGVRSGVNGTPTFFINGVRHDDSFAYGALVAALQHALEQAPAPRAKKQTKGK